MLPDSGEQSSPPITEQPPQLAAVTAAADAVDTAQEALWAAKRTLSDAIVAARQSDHTIEAISIASRRDPMEIRNTLSARASRTIR